MGVVLPLRQMACMLHSLPMLIVLDVIRVGKQIEGSRIRVQLCSFEDLQGENAKLEHTGYTVLHTIADLHI